MNKEVSSPYASTASFVRVLERTKHDFYHILAIDACSSVPIWRAAALSCLGSVFSLLGPLKSRLLASYANANASISTNTAVSGGVSGGVNGSSNINIDAEPNEVFATPSLLRVLDTLQQGGYLYHLVAEIGPKKGEVASDSATGGGAGGGLGVGGSVGGRLFNRSNEEQMIFERTLGLCTHIASTHEGIDVLIQCDLLDRLTNLPPIPTPYSVTSDLIEANFDEESLMRESHNAVDKTLMPILTLLRTMASTESAQTSFVLKKIAEFLNNNYSIVCYLLGLRIKSLRGLELVDSITVLLAMIAAAPSDAAATTSFLAGGYSDTKFPATPSPAFATTLSSSSSTTSSSSSSSSNITLWDAVFGARSDALTAALSELLAIFGSDPVPTTGSALNLTHKFTSTTTRVPTTWWTIIQPTTPEEEVLHSSHLDSTVSPPPTSSMS